jgi:aminoglycoside/choline kinase family phosphotransferase
MTANKTTANITNSLEKLFEEHFGVAPESIELLPVSGSDRRYYRLRNKTKTAIGTYNTNVAENNTYFYFTDLFRKHEINVPEIYKTSKDRRTYLQQDLGGISLFDQVTKEGFTDTVRQNYHKAIEQLVRAQWIAGREANFNQCFSTKVFDEKAIMADLFYFKYYFADLQKIHYDKNALMSEMERMSKELANVQPQMLMYRDFQSRNIMLHEGKAFLIDFQGCMKGSVHYDLASLLWQAKAQLPDAWKEDILNQYMATLHKLQIPRMDEIFFRKGYAQFVLLRLLQVLGAYGFRGLLQRKPHFISSISPALKNLENFLSLYPQIPNYPELRSLLEKLSTKEMQELYAQPSRKEDSNLQVTINSFSYKNGIPKDKTAHGGGYVFDCRGILNPGRYAAYKFLNGKDAVVQDFLRIESQMPDFLDHVFALVSMNVDEYLSRGFEHLSVSFGCTGGQHRSVFAAEQLAAYVTNRYQIPVTINHLNEERWVTEE